MSLSLHLEGADELIRQLRELPQELQTEATQIILSAAQALEIDVDEDYAIHEESGNLRGGLTLNPQAMGLWGYGAIVRNRARHSWMFEHGTAQRSYTGTDKRGRRFSDADRGRMWSRTPHQPTFIPSAQRHRRVMLERLKDLVRRAGFQVTG